MGVGKDLIFKAATLYHLKCPPFNKKLQDTQTGKSGPYTEEKQLIQTIPEEAKMLDLLDKDFKSAITNMFKELKETVSKEMKRIIKMMSQQIEDSNKLTDYF